MPITINLLAEERAAEETRRRDPVKRVGYAAAAVVGLVVVAIVIMQVKVSRVKGELTQKEGEWSALEKPAKAVEDSDKEIKAQKLKMDALNQLAANRFLWATPFDALQRCVVDHIQVLRISAEQAYIVKAAVVPPKGNKDIKSQPASSTEKLSITIQAKDTGNPNDQNYAKFIEAMANAPHFKDSLAKRGGITLLDRGEPQPDLSNPGKSFSLFTIKCVYPDTVR